ncbi:hypothetical protein BS47DRAFT_1399863 [Hydnum rufescens UP504]|uniref:Uncharacterized protein n=1 Tax=Hydnum rufescens UP504 TaxID=1448309 RepID=A0A9P6AHQ3_9AGAM|nr:hypothetical protein BS47DRAFT_1399863 [Hydnum rufescens UP504]
MGLITQPFLRPIESTVFPYNTTSPDKTKECRYDMLQDLVEFLLPPRYTWKSLSQQDLELGTTVEDAEGEDPEPGMSRMVRFESGSHRNDVALPPPQGNTIQRKGLLPLSLMSTRGNYSKLTERWLDSAIFHRRFLDAYLITVIEHRISHRIQGPFDTFMSGFSQLIARELTDALSKHVTIWDPGPRCKSKPKNGIRRNVICTSGSNQERMIELVT